MNEIAITAIQEAHFAAVVQLELDCDLKTGGVARLHKLFAEPSWMLLGAFDTSCNLVGFFAAQLVVDELQIDNVAVRATHRGRGLGARLVQAGLSAARARGAVTAVLEVRVSNIAAQRLYARNGFSVAGVRTGYYSTPVEDAWTMVCQLGAKT
jgi:[ribosomal protein S18]-alanine N-acetyltransferase